MKLSHVAFRVQNIDEAISHWSKTGFALEKRFKKSDPEAEVAWLLDEAGGGVELWQYTDETHPKSAHRARHMAFVSEDIHQDAQALIAGGFKETTPYTEGKLFNYMFLEDGFGMAFELLEEKQ
ncbi:MAG TPA: VOC family protein [Verrucomicrobiae bacterium]|nr:VOC family protein [Verrucomicrobiae bacterium]